MDTTQINVTKQVISALRTTVEFTEQNFAGNQSVKNKIVGTLSKLDAYLCFLSGEKPLSSREPRKFGEIVRDNVPVQGCEEMDDQKEQHPNINVDVAQLQEEVNQIFPTFITRDSDELLDTLTDLQLRGVAKKAGILVTETEPERLDVAFVEQVKDAIRLQIKLQQNDALPAKSPEQVEAETKLVEYSTKKQEYDRVILPDLSAKLKAAKGGAVTKAKEALDKAVAELKDIEGWIETYAMEIQSLGNAN